MTIDNGEEFSVNVLGALRILHSAWDKVTEQTTANCFSRAGFKLPNTNLEEDIIENEDVTPCLPEGVNFDDYISVDENVITTEVMSDDDIIEAISHTEPENEEEDSPPPPTPKQAASAMLTMSIL